jgi:quercetin dioxygenase-like cupin family protein
MLLAKWDELKLEEVNPMLSRRLVWGENVMVAYVYLKKDCIVPRHAHESEQVTQVHSGSLRLWIEEEGIEKEVTLCPGDVLVIPPMAPHRAEALEETLDVDIFSPIRHDWIQGTDDYLRR